jgi:hypothetical protein
LYLNPPDKAVVVDNYVTTRVVAVPLAQAAGVASIPHTLAELRTDGGEDAA